MKDYRTFLLLLLLAAALITLFSCCSWIYPLQPVDDANWYMSIGKSMLQGKLLYTDLHDQKGPLLFFLHEWAAVLSTKSFFGIYLLEVLCCFGFLSISYQTMRMFAGKGISLLTTSLVGVLTYSSDFMWYGDTVEELSLPILLYVLYKTLRYAKLGELPGLWESVLIGVGLAAVFWMKFTVLAMCVGVLAALFILAWQRRQVMLLLQSLTWVVAGAAGLTALILLYFVLHGNETDLYHSYFWFNLSLYTEAGKADASAALWPAKLAGWLMMVGFVVTRRISRDLKLAVALPLATELLTFVLLKVYLYYFLTIFVFAPLAIYYFRGIRCRAVLYAGTLVVSAFAACTNFNLVTLLTGNFPTAVLPLAETVNADTDPEKQVLTVKSYDTGIYTLTDCLPPIKFFSTPNAYVEELVREQTAFLESRKAKYLIMKTDGFEHYYGSFRPDLQRDYTLIQETKATYRTELLLHPLEFLWSLGYMNGFIGSLYIPEHRHVVYRLYRLKGAKAEKIEPQGLVGEWEATLKDGSRCVVSFSRHQLVRCRIYRGKELKADKTYSFTCHGDALKLGYMFTGEEYETAKITGMSATRLVLRGWPLKGMCKFSRRGL